MRLEVIALCGSLVASALLSCSSNCNLSCTDAVGLTTQAAPSITGAYTAKLCQNSTCVQSTTGFAENTPAAQFTGAISARLSTTPTNTVNVTITAPASEWKDGDEWSLTVLAQNGSTLLSVTSGAVKYDRRDACGTHCIQMTIPLN